MTIYEVRSNQYLIGVIMSHCPLGCSQVPCSSVSLSASNKRTCQSSPKDSTISIIPSIIKSLKLLKSQSLSSILSQPPLSLHTHKHTHTFWPESWSNSTVDDKVYRRVDHEHQVVDGTQDVKPFLKINRLKFPLAIVIFILRTSGKNL